MCSFRIAMSNSLKRDRGPLSRWTLPSFFHLSRFVFNLRPGILRMQVDAFPEMDEDATIRCAIQCLQAVTDFRGNEVRHPYLFVPFFYT